MNNLNLKYNVEDKPPLLQMLLFGLQWQAVSMPMIIIVGKVVSTLQFSDPAQQIIYLQKVFFIIGLSILVQVLWGHKLPIIVGPASVLLIGITASMGNGISTVYTSLLIGGLTLTFLSITGMFGYLKKLFTPRVVVTILMLIAFTMTPKLISLIFANTQESPLLQLVFALILIISLFFANRNLQGIWKSTLIIWAIILGSIIYFVLFPNSLTPLDTNTPLFSGFFTDFNITFSIEAGTLFSFLVCFLALAINDLGSIQAIGEMLNTTEMPKRTSRGITLTGILNILSGIFGVIGPVNYSTSPGVIASTGVASRYTLIPAGLGLMAMAFIPPAINLMGSIPSAVIGSVFTYILCSQLASGFLLAFSSRGEFRLENGLVLGLPLMLSLIISFMPESIIATFPIWLKPILGNGFVIGVIAVLIMEHLIYKEKRAAL